MLEKSRLSCRVGSAHHTCSSKIKIEKIEVVFIRFTQPTLEIFFEYNY